MLVINAVQSPHRIEVWANMTRADLLRALENPILSYFPYELSKDKDADFDKASEYIGYRYNK